MSGAENGLPAGWVKASIGELCEYNPKHSARVPPATLVSFVPMAAVSEVSGRIERAEVRAYGEVSRGFTHFADGDVIWAKITPCMENGKAAVAEQLTNGLACGSTEFMVFRSLGGVEPHYLHRFMRQESFRRSAKTTMKSGVGQARVPREFVVESKLPLAPLNEQRRIVAKLEALQARSDAAKAALDAIPPLLEQFRQSVLAAAFRGDLSKAWREAHPDVEPASVLLERIRAERRRKWQEANPKKAYVEPAPVDTAGLPELPAGWCWASVEELSKDERYALAIGPFGSNLKVSDYRGEGVPLVFVRDIRNGEFGGRGTKFIDPQKADELAAHRVEPGCVLVTKMGDPPGDTAIYPASRPTGVITSDCIKISPELELVSASYLQFALRTGAPRAAILRESKGVAQQKLSLERFRSVPVPVAPLAEQQAICGLLQSHFDGGWEVETQSRALAGLSSALSQSILAKAFRGELVPQDPSDEPASVLLERIRRERAGGAERGGGKRGRGKVAG